MTSDLDREMREEHRQGGGGTLKNQRRSYNSFALKILTCNPYGLKALRSIFANPRQGRLSKSRWGRGPHKRVNFPKLVLAPRPKISLKENYFLCGFPRSRDAITPTQTGSRVWECNGRFARGPDWCRCRTPPNSGITKVQGGK